MLCENKFKKKVEYRQKLKEDLRKRFRVEYLGQLALKSEKSETRTVEKGDIVLIRDPNHKRIDWPLARIEELITGRDGKVRVCLLKTKNGLMRRAIQSIYPLEIPTHPHGETRDLRQRAKNIEPKIVSKREKPCTNECNKKNDTDYDENCKLEIENNVTTRSGRICKKPQRFAA